MVFSSETISSVNYLDLNDSEISWNDGTRLGRLLQATDTLSTFSSITTVDEAVLKVEIEEEKKKREFKKFIRVVKTEVKNTRNLDKMLLEEKGKDRLRKGGKWESVGGFNINNSNSEKVAAKKTNKPASSSVKARKKTTVRNEVTKVPLLKQVKTKSNKDSSSVLISRLKNIYLNSSNTISLKNSFNSTKRKQVAEKEAKNLNCMTQKVNYIKKSKKIPCLNLTSPAVKALTLPKQKTSEKKLFSKNPNTFSKEIEVKREESKLTYEVKKDTNTTNSPESLGVSANETREESEPEIIQTENLEQSVELEGKETEIHDIEKSETPLPRYTLENLPSSISIHTILNESVSNLQLSSEPFGENEPTSFVNDFQLQQYLADDPVYSNHTSEVNIVDSRISLEKRKLCENAVNGAFKEIFSFHRQVLGEYFKTNENDETVLKNEEEDEDRKWRIIISLPSLYDKHGSKLIKIFQKNTIASLEATLIDKRIVGEIVYQLEQRVFNFIFNIQPVSRRCITNGYKPLNIKETIINFSTMNNENAQNVECLVDCEQLQKYLQNYEYLMKSFYEIGYDENTYQKLSSFLIMKYGLFPCTPIDYKIHAQNCNDDLELLFQMLISCVDEQERDYLIVLYTCLLLMAFEDKNPLFEWQ